MTDEETTPTPGAVSGSAGDGGAGVPAEASRPGAGPAPAASGATPRESSGPAAGEAVTGEAGPTEAPPASAATEAASPESSGAPPEEASPPETPAASGPSAEAAPAGATAPESGEGAAPAPAGELPVGDASAEADPATSPAGEMPAAESAGAPGAGPLTAERVQLVSESGQSLMVGVRTVLGKHMVRQLGEDFNVWDAEQCVLERTPDGTWQIVPREGTTNETMVNGEAIAATRPLSEGDVIAVGRAARGIVRMPLTVRSA